MKGRVWPRDARVILKTVFEGLFCLSGALWATSGPINACYDTTPLDTPCGVLSARAVAQNAQRLAEKDPEGRKSAVLRAIAAHLGSEAQQPLEYFELCWAEEPLIGGGYSVTLPPRAFTTGPSAFGEPHGPIHFAGTETANAYPGYMDGAVDAGERAAHDALQQIGA